MRGRFSAVLCTNFEYQTQASYLAHRDDGDNIVILDPESRGKIGQFILEALGQIGAVLTAADSNTAENSVDKINDAKNEDVWSKTRPQFYDIRAGSVLCGVILLNSKNGEAVILNTIEAYARTHWLDVHQESFRTIKGIAVGTSLPGVKAKERNEGFRPLTLMTADGNRLVIGTAFANILVTSCLRLDNNNPGGRTCSVGGTMYSFVIGGLEESNAIRIYLDESVNDAKASGPLMRLHVFMPYTVSTALDKVEGTSECAYSGAGLFRFVGDAMLLFKVKRSIAPVLPLDVVKRFRDCCKNNSVMMSHFDEILELYTSGQDPIPILGNKTLNRSPEEMANLPTPTITTANQRVACFIRQQALAQNIKTLEDDLHLDMSQPKKPHSCPSPSPLYEASSVSPRHAPPYAGGSDSSPAISPPSPPDFTLDGATVE
ncbi:hypothetical protein EDD21DRAFT_410661 [Dissophora ornata]|nr:hypothetical protein EDD21DRAFT_410661 [Dissophora ornata]